MHTIDLYSYRCGVIDCFNEVIHAGIKRLALSHPADTKEERDLYLKFSEKICRQYHTHMYAEDDLLVTDLFPVSDTKGKYLILYYDREETLRSYLDLKKEKERLNNSGKYCGEARLQIAQKFGRLLSYTEEAVHQIIESNRDREKVVEA